MIGLTAKNALKNWKKEKKESFFLNGSKNTLNLTLFEKKKYLQTWIGDKIGYQIIYEVVLLVLYRSSPITITG